MQSSSTVRNYAHKLPPLKESASRLASKLSGDASTTSSPDIAKLLERFDEPLRDGTSPASPPARPTLAASHPQVARPPAEENGAARSVAPKPMVAPAATRKFRLPLKGLITALLGIALVPPAVLLWQRMPEEGHQVAPAQELSVVSAPASTSSAQRSSALEVALSSPDRIEANAGDVVDFPIAIDATAALPARSIVTITALPEGATFSEGRPYGVTGWSLGPDEIGGLRLRLPARSASSDMRLELVAGDGTVLSQSATRLSIAPAPAVVATTDHPLSAGFAPSEQTATAGAIESAPVEQTAQAEVTGSVAEASPLPQQKPSSSIKSDSAPKVNTVKVVTIAPPGETKPHDGAYGLGPATEEAQAPGEWMETKTAVDMHAKAQQSSETVKVAAGGLKVRVTGRDKRWVQVTDPASATTGWIYDRFLKSAEPPAE
jgi:hypothetical protein